MLFALPATAEKWYRDFEYNGIYYSVLDEEALTCQTSAGELEPGAIKPEDGGMYAYGPTNLDIPGRVTDGKKIYTVIGIGEGSFYKVYRTEHITLPSTLQYIQSSAFSFDEQLKSITLPESLTEIGQYAFYSCDDLETIDLPESIITIGARAFDGCIKVSNVYIPKSLNTIGVHAFPLQASLTVDKDNQSFSDEDGILFNKDKSVLIQCPSTRSGAYEIPHTVSTIEQLAFNKCKITKAVVPNSVTAIHNEAFRDCESLEYLYIDNPTEIGVCAFYDCKNLKDVYYASANPIPFGKATFSAEAYTKATLHVREEALDLIRQIFPWGLFSNTAIYDFSGISDIEIDEDTTCEVYTTNGVRVGNSTENLIPGVYIVRRGSDVQKLIIK